MTYMVITLKVSGELKEELRKRKLYKNEGYEEVIWALLENNLELSEQTKRDIAEAEKQIAEGKYYTLEQVKKKLKL